MEVIKARIPIGRAVIVQTIELYTKEEAKRILEGKEWEIGTDIYSDKERGKRIGWIANFDGGNGIYVSVK